MKLNIPKLRSEHFFMMFICLYWGQEIIFSYIRAIILHIPIINYFADFVFPIMMIVFLLLSIPYIIRKITVKDILFITVIILVYLLHMLFYEKNSEWLISIGISFFSIVLPLYFIGLRIEIAKHFNIIYIMSIINIWSFTLYNLVSADGTTVTQATYDSFMHRAYVLLPQLLIIIGVMIKKNNFFNILTVIVGSVSLLMCGNRGSVLLLMIYIIIYMLFVMEKKKRPVFYISIVALCGFVMLFLEQLVDLLITVFIDLGMSTRVIDRLYEGSFFQSNGRDAITSMLLEAIWENPILGSGLASDRLVTGKYAHNYVLELWSAFGIVLGTVIVIATIFIIFKAWNKSKNEMEKCFLLMMICVGFLKLFISSSFLQEGLFFMLLGVCITQIRNAQLSRG